MLLLSILAREFCAAARRKRTWVLRFVLGAISAAVLYWLHSIFYVWSEATGRDVLLLQAWQGVIMLSLIAPLLTAGAITEERNNGTLGLLFLTHLRPLHIVLGKTLTGGLNLILLCAMLVPFLLMPVLLGGVDWQTTVGLALNCASLLLLCLALGLFCSTLTRATLQAAFAAYMLLFACYYGFGALYIENTSGPMPNRLLAALSPMTFLVGMIPSAIGTGGPVSIPVLDAVVGFTACLLLSSLLIFAAALVLPRRRLAPEPRKAGWWYEKRLTPWMLKPVFPRRNRTPSPQPHFWIAPRRARSPWLAQSVVVLISLFGLSLFFLVGVYGATSWEKVLFGLFMAGLLGWNVIKIAVLLHVTRAFADAKQSGSAEVLLTTPLHNSQIVRSGWMSLLQRYGPFCMLSLTVMVLIGPEIRRLGYGEIVLFDVRRVASLGTVAMLASSLVSWTCLSFYFSARLKKMTSSVIAVVLVAGFMNLVFSRDGLAWLEGIYNHFMVFGLRAMANLGASFGDVWRIYQVPIRVSADWAVAITVYLVLSRRLRDYVAR